MKIRIIKIIESVEDSGVLIDGVTETVKDIWIKMFSSIQSFKKYRDY